MALARHPKLILVDELAHTNATSCRNRKRYQDVQELLDAGIDVYTTVNVQHIESLNDVVQSITGIKVRERIPDSIFDSASQVTLVDIEPQELIERLNKGKIYKETQAQMALSHFFSIENLIALREIALRRCADRISIQGAETREMSNAGVFTHEHILVCLSSSPSNPKIIRTGARMAKAFHATFTALFVEMPNMSGMSDQDKERLRANTHLAKQLGASIETTYGEDIAYQIAEFARLSGVSKIVIGRSNAHTRKLFGKPNLTEKLTRYAQNLDIYIIPDADTRAQFNPEKEKRHSFEFHPLEAVKSLLLLSAATALGSIFYLSGFSEANIITIYILSVLLTAVVTSGWIYYIFSSALSVLVFNFFFTIPRFSFTAYDPSYPVTFMIMFLSACITGNLATKIKNQGKEAAQAAYRMKVMFDTNQALQKADGKKEIVAVASTQLMHLLGRDIVFYPILSKLLGTPSYFPIADTKQEKEYANENEMAVAHWVFKNNRRAGASTDTLYSAKYLYLPLRIEQRIYGVVGIDMTGKGLGSAEESMVLSILGECAMALENEQTSYEKEQVAIYAKNEQLKANLLRSISHDLRTPLTAISGSAGVLLSGGNALSEDKRHTLYTDIYDDSMWLINLVENLLSVTRIKEGSMTISKTPELVEEVIEEALKHSNKRENCHQIRLEHRTPLLMAKMDVRLIVQVVINIMDNAIKYAPSGTPITIITYAQGGRSSHRDQRRRTRHPRWAERQGLRDVLHFGEQDCR